MYNNRSQDFIEEMIDRNDSNMEKVESKVYLLQDLQDEIERGLDIKQIDPRRIINVDSRQLFIDQSVLDGEDLDTLQKRIVEDLKMKKIREQEAIAMRLAQKQQEKMKLKDLALEKMYTTLGLEVDYHSNGSLRKWKKNRNGTFTSMEKKDCYLQNNQSTDSIEDKKVKKTKLPIREISSHSLDGSGNQINFFIDTKRKIDWKTDPRYAGRDFSEEELESLNQYNFIVVDSLKKCQYYDIEELCQRKHEDRSRDFTITFYFEILKDYRHGEINMSAQLIGNKIRNRIRIQYFSSGKGQATDNRSTYMCFSFKKGWIGEDQKVITRSSDAQQGMKYREIWILNGLFKFKQQYVVTATRDSIRKLLQEECLEWGVTHYIKSFVGIPHNTMACFWIQTRLKWGWQPSTLVKEDFYYYFDENNYAIIPRSQNELPQFYYSGIEQCQMDRLTEKDLKKVLEWRKIELKEETQGNNQPVGIFISGPPGCGKTTIANMIARIGGFIPWIEKVITGNEIYQKSNAQPLDWERLTAEHKTIIVDDLGSLNLMNWSNQLKTMVEGRQKTINIKFSSVTVKPELVLVTSQSTMSTLFRTNPITKKDREEEKAFMRRFVDLRIVSSKEEAYNNIRDSNQDGSDVIGWQPVPQVVMYLVNPINQSTETRNEFKQNVRRLKFHRIQDFDEIQTKAIEFYQDTEAQYFQTVSNQLISIAQFMCDTEAQHNRHLRNYQNLTQNYGVVLQILELDEYVQLNNGIDWTQNVVQVAANAPKEIEQLLITDPIANQQSQKELIKEMISKRNKEKQILQQRQQYLKLEQSVQQENIIINLDENPLNQQQFQKLNYQQQEQYIDVQIDNMLNQNDSKSFYDADNDIEVQNKILQQKKLLNQQFIENHYVLNSEQEEDDGIIKDFFRKRGQDESWIEEKSFVSFINQDFDVESEEDERERRTNI